MTKRPLEELARQHIELSRRFFVQLGAAGVAGASLPLLDARGGEDDDALRAAIASLEYLTKVEDFRMVGRGNPKPHTLSPEKRLEVGLDRKTWKLEVVADPESNARVQHPLTKELGTAIDWPALMKLAKSSAVRFMKVMSCTNVGQPLGMGLWEGVPLRAVIWLARPTTNIRRVFYYGFHNDDPEQRFQSSLPIDRVLEDPPGEHPVILCYKLNDQLLTPAGGAPVRIIVPDAYGNKSVKWLQKIVLTNEFQANDTYAGWNNDTVSHSKTFARFIQVPAKAKVGQPIAVTGLAQVGMSGLSKVQILIQAAGTKPTEEDPYYTNADWRDVECLPAPDDWGGGLAQGKLPPIPSQIDATSGKPHTWPLRDTIVHWATLVTDLPAGKQVIRCRTIDANGIAQPMPRPFQKSGANRIQSEKVQVEETKRGQDPF